MKIRGEPQQIGYVYDADSEKNWCSPGKAREIDLFSLGYYVLW